MYYALFSISPSPEIERLRIPRLPADIMHSVRNKSPDIDVKKCIFDLKQLEYCL